MDLDSESFTSVASFFDTSFPVAGRPFDIQGSMSGWYSYSYVSFLSEYPEAENTFVKEFAPLMEQGKIKSLVAIPIVDGESNEREGNVR